MSCIHRIRAPMSTTTAPEKHEFQAEIARVQPWVLARQDERRLQPALGERVRDGRHLDRFRPGADDQPDVGETQYSP